MFPINLNVNKCKLALIGDGPEASRRLQLLKEAGATQVDVFTKPPFPKEKLGAYHVVMIASLEDEVAFELAEAARAQGTLVNVEDRREYCDFYYPSIVRRGDLVMSISTSGKSPTLAVRIREYLEQIFPAIWKDRVDEVAQYRQSLKKEGISYQGLIDRTNKWLDQKGWLST